MTRKANFILVLLTAFAIAAIASHAVVRWVGIVIKPAEQRILALSQGKPMAFAAGSSIMFDGLDWTLICRTLGEGVETWFVPGSSPSEWSPLQRRAPQAQLTFLVVSPYDLNEYFLCDVHADVVSLRQTVLDLWHSGADWHFSRRVLSQYPLKYTRMVFPSAGRSEGILVGVREQIRRLLSPWISMETEAGPAAPRSEGLHPERVKTENIGEWSRSKTLRRITSMRSSCQGKHAYNGPKVEALVRMLDQAQQQGRVIVIVLPVSPLYNEAFLDSSTLLQFDAALAEAQHAIPQAQWVRLDQAPSLKTNEYFWDLVHLNMYGQKAATELFMSQLQNAANSP